MISSKLKQRIRQKQLRESVARPKTVVKGYNANNTKWLNESLDRWGDLVEDVEGYSPIRNNWTKAVTAAMMDNQYNLAKSRGFMNKNLNESTAMNTSVFGPKYGTSGGTLHSGDNFAPGDFRNPVAFMPVIRRTFPSLIANEVVGVQPMPNSTTYAVAVRYKYLRGANAPADSSVHHIHTNNGKGEEGGNGYDSEGIRGIQSKYSYDSTNNVINIVDVDGFPKSLPVASVIPTKNDKGEDKFTAVISPVVDQILGAKVSWGQGIVNQDTPDKALQAAQKKISAVFEKYNITTGYYVGMSQTDAPYGQLSATNDELGFQRVDTRFTGAVNNELARPLAGGRWQFRPEDTGVGAWVQSYEATASMARTAFDFSRIVINAVTRKIATTWTPELEEDLRNNSGIDVNEQAVTMLTYELTAEIDRECHVRMLYQALYNNEWSIWKGENADARWHGERAHALYLACLKQSMRMEARNHRGPANFLIVSPDVAAALEGLNLFQPFPADVNLSTNSLAVSKIGTLGGNRFTVYVDHKSPIYDKDDYGYGYDYMFDSAGTTQKGMPNYILLGYKGADAFDAGIIFCPYIPMMMHSATDPWSFTTQVGLSTRYAIADNIFGAHLYYHVIIVEGLGQAGLPDNVKKFYPAGLTPASVADTAGTFAVPVKATISGEVQTTTAGAGA